jgi:16S rRNA (cytidine1402-2'-O)-methyltransferase
MAGAADGQDAPRGRAKLSVVATPIGNLEDLSARALATLRACDRLAAEDTRRTRALLTHFGIAGKTMIALHAHSSEDDVARVVAHLQDGEHVAVVTDAGTPLVSDPGSELVRAAIAAGVRVEPIPGPSAVTAALCASGLATDAGFRFLGFLPRDGVARGRAIAVVCETPESVVIFEAPNRTSATLRELAAATPDRAACVARELTKLHEEVVRGTLRQLAELGADREWIGEIAIVLGAHDPDARGGLVDDAALEARIDEELGKGLHAKTIAERLAAWSGRPKRDVYERVVARKRGAP